MARFPGNVVFSGNLTNIGENMDIDIKMVLAQQKELQGYADSLQSVRFQIKQYQENLNRAWHGNEIEALNQSLVSMLHQMQRMSMELEDIGQNLLETYQQLEEAENHESED